MNKGSLNVRGETDDQWEAHLPILLTVLVVLIGLLYPLAYLLEGRLARKALDSPTA